MKPFLRCTRSRVQNAEGLELLRLALWKGGKEFDHVTVVSGQPGRQNFRKAAESQAGSMEPIPEGRWKLGSPAWAGKPGDWSSEWNGGLGPVVVDISTAPNWRTNRGELRIHPDWNESYAPGTAGCLGVQGETGERDLTRMKKVLGWLQDHPELEDLETDWGLGTISKPG